MILNILALAYGAGIWATLSLCKSTAEKKMKIDFHVLLISLAVPPWRNRFSQEYDEGLYSGTTLLLAYESVSMPFSIISSAISVCILYP